VVFRFDGGLFTLATAATFWILLESGRLAFATNLVGKRIIMIPSANAVNLQTLDLNKALETIPRK
jgi:hypothetical protein